MIEKCSDKSVSLFNQRSRELRSRSPRRFRPIKQRHFSLSLSLARSATYAGYVAVLYGVIWPGLTDPLHVDVSIEGDAPLGGLPPGDGSPNGR